MAIGDIVILKKGRPKTNTEPVLVRLPQNIVEAIEAFRREQETIPTRPEAIRTMLQDWLTKSGYLK